MAIGSDQIRLDDHLLKLRIVVHLEELIEIDPDTLMQSARGDVVLHLCDGIGESNDVHRAAKHVDAFVGHDFPSCSIPRTALETPGPKLAAAAMSARLAANQRTTDSRPFWKGVSGS